MVGGQLIHHTPRHEEPHRNIHDTQKWSHVHSVKQKFNTKSSTEAELVAVNDTMGQVIAAQGQPILTTTICQDNKSTILLAEYGKASSSKRTHHIKICYYFVADRIKKEEVKVAYCPTTNMLADFFTKPLQGRTFKNAKCHTEPARH